MSSEIATTSDTSTALAPLTPLYDSVDVSDIMLPNIYLLQPLSKAVTDDIGKPGDVILSLGSDDPMPEFLINSDKTEFTAYIVGRERFAATTADGSLRFHPDGKRDPSDPDSWDGWFFFLAVPEVDEVVPARLMLWKTAGMPAARAINTIMERTAFRGDTSPVPVTLSVASKTNKRGQSYFAFRVAPAPVNKDKAEIAKNVQITYAGLKRNRAAENDAPQIGGQPEI